MKNILFLIAFYIGMVPLLCGQDLNSPQDAEDFYRPTRNDLGFNISMNLSSGSEMLEGLYLSDEFADPGIFGGLGMSFRLNVSEKVALRTNASFFNTRQQNIVPFRAPIITTINSFMWNNGLMLIFKGTDKLEPYGFLDIGFGRTRAIEDSGTGGTPNIDQMNFLRTAMVTSGLGFNYYFARNIGFGIEWGTGIKRTTFPQEFRENSHSIQFFSGIGGKLGVTIIF